MSLSRINVPLISLIIDYYVIHTRGSDGSCLLRPHGGYVMETNKDLDLIVDFTRFN